MDTNTQGPLTMSQLGQLQTIAEAAQTNARVRWLNAHSDVMEGTARSIGHEDSTFLGTDEDVRDGFLRITSVMGFDHYLSVTGLMAMVERGEFAIDR